MMQQWDPDNVEIPGPFDGTELSGADVYWIVTQTLAEELGDSELAQTMLDKVSANVDTETGSLCWTMPSEFPLFMGWPVSPLAGADLSGAELQGAVLARTNLVAADLTDTNLTDAIMVGACLVHARLSGTRLQNAVLLGAELRHAHIFHARFSGANLGQADLRCADFATIDLSGVVLQFADLRGADLRSVKFDAASALEGAKLDGALFDQAVLGDVNLAVVDWDQVRVLGDETEANNRTSKRTPYDASDGTEPAAKEPNERHRDYTAASRAYNLVASALSSQGLAKPAYRFRYRARVMERKASYYSWADQVRPPSRLVSKLMRSLPSLIGWLISWVLDRLVGYGYKLSRIAWTYLFVVCGYAAVYLIAVHWPLKFHLTLNLSAWWYAHGTEISDALVLSITSFHGRGWLQSTTPSLSSDPIIGGIAASEALVGLLVEGLFIAALLRTVSRE